MQRSTGKLGMGGGDVGMVSKYRLITRRKPGGRIEMQMRLLQMKDSCKTRKRRKTRKTINGQPHVEAPAKQSGKGSEAISNGQKAEIGHPTYPSLGIDLISLNTASEPVASFSCYPLSLRKRGISYFEVEPEPRSCLESLLTASEVAVSAKETAAVILGSWLISIRDRLPQLPQTFGLMASERSQNAPF